MQVIRYEEMHWRIESDRAQNLFMSNKSQAIKQKLFYKEKCNLIFSRSNHSMLIVPLLHFF